MLRSEHDYHLNSTSDTNINESDWPSLKPKLQSSQQSQSGTGRLERSDKIHRGYNWNDARLHPVPFNLSDCWARGCWFHIRLRFLRQVCPPAQFFLFTFCKKELMIGLEDTLHWWWSNLTTSYYIYNPRDFKYRACCTFAVGDIKNVHKFTHLRQFG